MPGKAGRAIAATSDLAERTEDSAHADGPDGSIMIVIATDAPVNHIQLTRISKRAAFGLARTGSFAAHGSGDIVLAFSTAHRLAHYPKRDVQHALYLADDGEMLSRLFAMTVEAVEEAIWNSLCKATTMRGHKGRIRQAVSYDLFDKRS